MLDAGLQCNNSPSYVTINYNRYIFKMNTRGNLYYTFLILCYNMYIRNNIIYSALATKVYSFGAIIITNEKVVLELHLSTI